jgi:hypothetical protein
LRKPSIQRFVGLALLAGFAGTAPARAAVTQITTATTIPITINAGDEVDILSGGSVSVATGPAVTVNGGTMVVDGGSVSAAIGPAIRFDVFGGAFTIYSGQVSTTDVFADAVVDGFGTTTVYGGSISGGAEGLFIEKTAAISGGSVSGSAFAFRAHDGGQLTVSGGTFSGSVESSGTDALITFIGCNLNLTGGQLTGALADGTPINVLASASDSGQIVLQNLFVGPPSISSVSASPSQIWPPNHKWVDVTVNYITSQNCGPTTSHLSVSNNETGTADKQVIDAHHVRLLAERAGNGSDRVYTITITATDTSGSSSQQTVAVTVPHDP